MLWHKVFINGPVAETNSLAFSAQRAGRQRIGGGMRSKGAWAYVAIAVAALGLTACSGGSSSMPPPATYTVGGSISGLTAAGLVLGNGSDSYAAGANATTFTFATALQSGSSY